MLLRDARAIVAVGCVACSAALTFAPSAAAQTEEQIAEARRRFAQGSTEFLSHKYAEALEDLRRSHKLVPSPNSGLLIARCLRELKRPVEAVETYASVAADARKRAADGDAKYLPTADAADAEGAQVRATLGTLKVKVAHAPSGSQIEIDGQAYPAGDHDVALLHAPGEVAVRFRPPSGPPQSQRTTVVSSAEVLVEFDGGAAGGAAPPAGAIGPTGPTPPPPPPPETPPSGSPPAWTKPAAFVAGGVALVGTAVFVGFGLQSESIYSRLDKRCGPDSCGPADRADADAGKRDQTIANVGLAVGIVGVASVAAILLYRAYGPRTAVLVLPGAVHATF